MANDPRGRNQKLPVESRVSDESPVTWVSAAVFLTLRTGAASLPSAMTPKTPAAKARAAQRARAGVLAAWRGPQLASAEMAARRASRTVGDILPQVLSTMRLDQKLAESQIQAVWARVIDPTVAAHARPVGLARGTLFVTVDSNTWLSEIVRYRRHEILERLQLAAGKATVERISFRVG